MNESYSSYSSQPADPSAQTFRAFWPCFLLMLAVLPFSIVRPTQGWVLTIVIFLTTALFLSFWLKFFLGSFITCRRTDMDVWFLAYAVFFVLSAALTEVPCAVIPQFYRVGSMALFFMSALYVGGHRPQVKLFAQSLSFTGAFISLVILLRFSNYFLRTLLSTNSLQMFLGFYIMALPVCLGYALVQRERSKRTFFIFLCLIMGSGFITLGSKPAVLCLCISLCILVMLLNRRSILRNSGRFLAVVAAVLMLALIWYLACVFAVTGYTLPIATEKMGILSKNFWLGFGPSVSDFASNDYLRLWSEGGLVMTLITLTLFFVAAKEAWFVIRFQFSKLKCSVAAGYLSALIGLMLHGIFYANFHTPAYSILFWSLTGIVFSLSRSQSYPRQFDNRVLKRVVVVLCIVLMAMAGWLGSAGLFRWMGRNDLDKGDSANAIFYLNKSVSINPFNAESYYWRAIAKKKSGMDDMAVLDFKKAASLNPYNPRYFWLEEDMSGVNLETAHDYYYSAEQIVRSDPRQNPLLEQRLDQMLYKCLELDPAYGEKAAELLWGYYMDTVHLEKFFNETENGLPGFVLFIEKNGLWRIHRRYLLKSLGSSIEAVDQDLAEHVWGPAEDLRVEGKMEQNSAIKIEREFTSAPVRLTVHARGTAAAEVYPQLLIRIDNLPVDSFAVNSSAARTFETVLHIKPGSHLLSLEFINDRYSLFSGAPFQPRRFIVDFFHPHRNAKKEDRNLWIEKAEIAYSPAGQ